MCQIIIKLVGNLRFFVHHQVKTNLWFFLKIYFYIFILINYAHNSRPYLQAIGKEDPKSSPLKNSQLEFHLHATRFEPITFQVPGSHKGLYQWAIILRVNLRFFSSTSNQQN